VTDVPTTTMVSIDPLATTDDPDTSIRVVNGDVQIGTLRRRFWQEQRAISFEAFDLDAKSLGIFPDERSAAEALWRRARGQQLPETAP